MHFRIIVTIIPRRFLTTKNVFGWNIAKDHVDCSLRSVAFILRWCNWFPYQHWIIFNLSMMPVSYIHWGHYNSTLWPWQKTFYDDQHHESPLSGESLTFVTAWTAFSGSPDTKLPLSNMRFSRVIINDICSYTNTHFIFWKPRHKTAITQCKIEFQYPRSCPLFLEFPGGGGWTQLNFPGKRSTFDYSTSYSF